MVLITSISQSLSNNDNFRQSQHSTLYSTTECEQSLCKWHTFSRQEPGILKLFILKLSCHRVHQLLTNRRIIPRLLTPESRHLDQGIQPWALAQGNP